jgi:hypothetical protein
MAESRFDLRPPAHYIALLQCEVERGEGYQAARAKDAAQGAAAQAESKYWAEQAVIAWVLEVKQATVTEYAAPTTNGTSIANDPPDSNVAPNTAPAQDVSATPGTAVPDTSAATGISAWPRSFSTASTLVPSTCSGSTLVDEPEPCCGFQFCAGFCRGLPP